MSNFYFGVCESRMDPMYLGRCKVRVIGVHTENKGDLPTDDLPWALPLQPITSAGISGIGTSPTGIVEGSWVMVVFLDDAKQQPIMMGTLGGFNENIPFEFDNDSTIGTVNQYNPTMDKKVPASSMPNPIPDEAVEQIKENAATVTTTGSLADAATPVYQEPESGIPVVKGDLTTVSGKIASASDAIAQKATSLFGAIDGITNKIASQFSSMTKQVETMGSNLIKTFGDRINVDAITKDLQEIIKTPGGVKDAGIDKMPEMISAGQVSINDFNKSEAKSIVENIHETLADLEQDQIGKLLSEGFTLGKFNVLKQVAKSGIDKDEGQKAIVEDVTKADIGERVQTAQGETTETVKPSRAQKIEEYKTLMTNTYDEYIARIQNINTQDEKVFAAEADGIQISWVAIRGTRAEIAVDLHDESVVPELTTWIKSTGYGKSLLAAIDKRAEELGLKYRTK